MCRNTNTNVVKTANEKNITLSRVDALGFVIIFSCKANFQTLRLITSKTLLMLMYVSKTL